MSNLPASHTGKGLSHPLWVSRACVHGRSYLAVSRLRLCIPHSNEPMQVVRKKAINRRDQSACDGRYTSARLPASTGQYYIQAELFGGCAFLHAQLALGCHLRLRSAWNYLVLQAPIMAYHKVMARMHVMLLTRVGCNTTRRHGKSDSCTLYR